ncbi:MAG: exosortase/archaeosortase family protein [Fervidobacterium sp.]
MWKKPSLHIATTQLWLAVKIGALLLAPIALFCQDLIVIFSDALQSETTSHLLAVPLLFAYLIYRKRKMLRAAIPFQGTSEQKETRHMPLICGVLLSATAILLYWYGSYTFTPVELHMLALPIFVAGLTLILCNPQTLRQLAFPITFLMFLMPPPSEILYTVGSALSVVSAEASNAIVNAFGIPSTITTEYGNPTITITRPEGTPLNFTVDIACSGIYSLIGFLIFVVFIIYIIRDKLWKRLTLLILGIPLIYLLNIIRITILLTIGYHYGEQLALQIFHLLGGWLLIFLGTLLLLAISEKIFKTQIFAPHTEKCPHPDSSSPSLFAESFCFECGRILKPANPKIRKSDIAKIVAITANIILFISIQAPVFALAQTSPIVIIDTPSGQQVSTEILPQVSDYELYFWYRDTQFEAKAKQDMSLIYLYEPINESKNYMWVTIEIASTISSLHRWETCLITWPLSKGYQPKVNQIELKDSQIIQNPPIIGRYFVFQYKDTNLTEAVLYWYETAVFTVNLTSQQKYVEISVIAYPETLEELPEVENQMMLMAMEIASYWQPIKLWSQVTMIISQNGANLAAVTGVLAIALICMYLVEDKRQAKVNANVYQKLSRINQQTVDIVKKTESSRLTPTLNNIAVTYKETEKKRIAKSQLLRRLLEVEKVGIIKRVIANQNDEPILIWKTKIK